MVAFKDKEGIMRKILIISMVLFFAISARCDYARYKLIEMIQLCDFAVVGTITELDSDKFTIRIDENIIGEHTGNTMKIVRFLNWECARRWARYLVGQQEVIFIRKSNNFREKYELRVIGLGDEGEIRIEHDTVQSYSFPCDEYNYPLKDFINAVKDYRKSGEQIKKLFEERMIEDPFLAEFASRSSIHNRLIRDSERRYGGRKEEIIIPKGFKSALYQTAINVLFKNCENPINIATNEEFDSIVFKAENCKFLVKNEQFLVIPDCDYYALIHAYGYKNDSAYLIDTENFKIAEIPEPYISFANSSGNKVSKGDINHSWASLFTQYPDLDLDFTFEIVSFKIEVEIFGKKEVYSSVSNRITTDMKNAVSKMKYGSKIYLYDIIAYGPDEKRHILNPQAYTLVKDIY